MNNINVVIRTNNKFLDKKKNTIKQIRYHISYLKRHQDVLEFVSSGLTETQFCQLLNNRQPQRMIISPAYRCNMKELVQVTINVICKYNNIKKLEYLAYIHYDTSHPHAHVIILPPKYKTNFKASGRFIQEAILPDVNRYLDKIYLPISEQEFKTNYINSVNNIGQAKVDYDILRLCDRKKYYSQQNEIVSLVYNKNKESKIEYWKIPYVHKRINNLIEENIGIKTDTNIEFPSDFIFKKIIRGKLSKHINLPKNIIGDIQLKKISEKEIDTVLSVIVDNEKHILSRVVKTVKGNYVLNEKKIKKSLTEYNLKLR